jgi:hypothetical protein
MIWSRATPDNSQPSAFDLDQLAQATGARSFGLALASDLRYVRAPSLSDGAVRAVLGGTGDGSPAGDRRGECEVALLQKAAGGILGHCSRCPQVFGPCQHVTVLAVDLALSAPLRTALFAGLDTTDAAASTLGLRTVLRA